MAHIANATHATAEQNAAGRSHAQIDTLKNSAPKPRALLPLDYIDAAAWQRLSDNAIEPNGFYMPEWESAVNKHVGSRGNVSALAATDCAQNITGLLPVISAWRAYKIPMPVLVSADPYGTLSTPPIDHAHVDAGASGLLDHARASGAHALVLRDVALDGAALKALTGALAQDGLQPQVLSSHVRACLDATRNADELLRDALGPKKLKELRRQRNRLGDEGDVIFTIASTPTEVKRDLEIFLSVEASGWKAKRGTALIQDYGDAAFIRSAAPALAARGQCEVVTLHAGPTPVASAILLRHRDRAFYFKIGVDERYSKLSPGVQLSVDVTRHMCADPAINLVDSTAIPDHPMIDPIWRNRLAVGDVLIPLYRSDPVVRAFRLALSLRNAAREPARRAVHLIRKIREKKS